MFNRGNTKSITMKLEKLASTELLAYSTILENIITTNLGLQGEISESVQNGFCTKEDIEPIYTKSKNASEEADTIYSEIQKELDLRAKRDLGMKFGIRRTQTIIKELDAFVAKTNEEFRKAQEIQNVDAERIAAEVPADLKVIKDDQSS